MVLSADLEGRLENLRFYFPMDMMPQLGSKCTNKGTPNGKTGTDPTQACSQQT